MKINDRIVVIFTILIISVCTLNSRAYSQGNIHLGPLEINAGLSEKITVDDNIYQVSGKGEDKQSDVINTYTPALNLLLPLRGLFPVSDQSDISLDWHSDILNYKDHADQNQQNHFFTLNAKFRFPRGFDVIIYDNYVDTWGTAGSETDTLHPRISNTGRITVSAPDYFRRIDVDFSYTNEETEYDEAALVRANRNEHAFTMKIPYKLSPKITVFPEYTYGITNIDRPDIGGPGEVKNLVNSHWNDFLVGVEWDLSGKTMGLMKFGYRSRNYHSSEVSELNMFVAEIGVRVNLSERTTLDISLGRNQEESEFTLGSNAFDSENASVTISHRIRNRITATFSSTYNKSSFHDSERKDEAYDFKLSGKYDFKEWFYIDTEFSYKDKHSNVDSQADRINRASIGLGVAF